MKLRYIITIALSSLALLAGCTKEQPTDSLKSIKVSKSYVAIAPAGSTETVTITSDVAWSFTPTSDDLKWLTFSATSGAAGSTVNLQITAAKCDYGRQTEIQIKAGVHTQFLTIRQGEMTVETVTCKQAMTGTAGKTYRIKGAVKSIVNDQYGNMYLDDGSGVEGYIYGTLDKNGAEKNFGSLGIELGDVVTVEGPLTYYNGTTPELVNVTVLSIEKSLLKITNQDVAAPKDGGEYKIEVAYKGNGVFFDIDKSCQDWISLKTLDYTPGIPSKMEKAPADTAILVFNIAPNVGGARQGSVQIASASGNNNTIISATIAQEGAIVECSIAEFNAAAVGKTQYKLTGVVTGIAKADYGNIYIADWSGETYVYGVGAKGDFAKTGVKVGDVVTVIGVRDEYKGTIEMTGCAKFENVISVEKKTLAEFKALPDNKNAYYMISGKVAKPTEDGTKWDLTQYGNFALTDGTTEVYVYGVRTGWNGAKGKFGELKVKEGDDITIIAYKTSYKGLIEADGCFWFAEHK